MPDLYAKHCSKVSLADFLVIIGEAVMGRAATKYDASEPFEDDSVLANFRDNFKYGRKTVDTCGWSKKRLPNPAIGCDSL